MCDKHSINFFEVFGYASGVLDAAIEAANANPDYNIFVTGIINGQMTYAHISKKPIIYDEKNLRRKFKPRRKLPTESFQVLAIHKKQPLKQFIGELC